MPKDRKKASTEVLHVVRQVRPFLKELVGDEGKPILQEVDHLLTAARRGEEVDVRLTDVLSRHPRTKVWLRKAIFAETQRLEFEPAPGGVPAPVTRYVCPVQGCGFDYIPFRAGRPIPPCLIHDCALIPAEETEER